MNIIAETLGEYGPVAKTYRIHPVITAIVFSLLTASCQSGGNNSLPTTLSNNKADESAQAVIKINWPVDGITKETIPPNTGSIGLNIDDQSDPSIVVPSVVVNRPMGSSSTTSTVVRLTAAKYKFIASAYSGPSGAGSVLASGESDETLIAGKENNVDVKLVPTAIATATPTVVGDTYNYQGKNFDSSNPNYLGLPNWTTASQHISVSLKIASPLLPLKEYYTNYLADEVILSVDYPYPYKDSRYTLGPDIAIASLTITDGYHSASIPNVEGKFETDMNGDIIAWRVRMLDSFAPNILSTSYGEPIEDADESFFYPDVNNLNICNCQGEILSSRIAWTR